MTFLSEELTLSLKARHIQQDSILYLNGRSVDGTIKCADGDGTIKCADGELPSCDDEILTVTLDEAPESFGLNFMQVQSKRCADADSATPDGLFSNDIMFYSEQVEKPDIPGNLIVSGGDFTNFEFPLKRFWNRIGENFGSNVPQPTLAILDIRRQFDDTIRRIDTQPEGSTHSTGFHTVFEWPQR